MISKHASSIIIVLLLGPAVANAASDLPHKGAAKFYNTALGADLSHGQRCSNFDQLQSNVEAFERMEWAFFCNYVPTSYRVPWTLMIDPQTQGVVPRGLNQYPVFARFHPTESWKRWIPNAQKVDRGDGKGAVFDCTMPDDVIWYAVCEASCYTAEQRILFGSGYIAIQKADEETKRDLVTLSPDASWNNLSFIVNKAERYTKDIQPGRQHVIGIFTESGSLRVTPNHPILTADGTLKPAEEFSEHEFLIKTDGSRAEIIAITNEEYDGTVYNVMPETTDLVSNIVVSEGFLTGSTRYQNEYIDYMNRLILRETFPPHALPSQ